MRRLFNHVDVVVSSLERSLLFYRELLRRLGWEGEGPIRGDVDRYRVGLHHLAFDAASRAMVDGVASWASPDGLKLEVVQQP